MDPYFYFTLLGFHFAGQFTEIHSVRQLKTLLQLRKSSLFIDQRFTSWFAFMPSSSPPTPPSVEIKLPMQLQYF